VRDGFRAHRLPATEKPAPADLLSAGPAISLISSVTR
jgi:hypothetical protein